MIFFPSLRCFTHTQSTERSVCAADPSCYAGPFRNLQSSSLVCLSRMREVCQHLLLSRVSAITHALLILFTSVRKSVFTCNNTPEKLPFQRIFSGCSGQEMQHHKHRNSLGKEGTNHQIRDQNKKEAAFEQHRHTA